jgi:hypothetical protein
MMINMKKNLLPILALSVVMTPLAPAAVVTFTGGTAYGNMTVFDRVNFQFNTVTSGVTDGTKTYSSVDYYKENGFVFDYVGGTGGSIGNYYGVNNDVIHAHWGQSEMTGGQSEMTGIEISKDGGGTFDFNYFVLTTNTLNAGGSPTGFEDVHVQAWLNGSMVGSDVILPSEEWGFPARDVFFGTVFDNVDKVVINSTHTSFSCFGMDEFYIDQSAPVPEPTAGALLALGLGGLIALRRLRRV